MKRLTAGSKIVLITFAFYLVILGIFSCGKKSTKPKDGNPTINFNTDILPLLQARCNASGCHSGATSADSAGGLVFSSFESMRQTVRKKIAVDPSERTIIPNNADSSHLVQNIRGQLTPIMPPAPQPGLTSQEIDKVAAWINQGAKGPNGEQFLAFEGGKVYVANASDGTVDIIDPLINFKVGSILAAPSGVIPSIVQTHHLVVSPDKKLLYATNAWSLGDLVKIDATGDTVLSRVRAGFQPADIVISPDGNFVYTADYNLNLPNTSVIRKINTQTMQVVDTFPVGKAPHGVAISKNGNLVVAPSQYSDDCWFIYPNGDSTYRLRLSPGVPNNPAMTSTFYSPIGAILSRNDSLAYVSCFANRQIRIIDVRTREVIDSIVLDVNQGKNPLMMTIDSTGTTLYVACWGSNSVAEVNLSTRTVNAYISVGQRAHAPVLAKTGSLLYVTCEGDHVTPYKVYVITASNRTVVDSISVGRYPNGISVLGP